MYYQGKGVAQDHKQAAAWWRRAADQDFAQAQYNLGALCYEGKGVAQDHKQAAAWYRRAADQGDAQAKAALQKLQQTQFYPDRARRQSPASVTNKQGLGGHAGRGPYFSHTGG